MAARLLLALSALAVSASALRAEVLPVTMLPHQTEGQTFLFRGQVSAAGLGSIRSVTVTDDSSAGGSSGVFSGFDLDFIAFDLDGDFATTADRIVPLDSPLTTVTPGIVRKGAASPYTPTAMHPGPLFGLEADGDLDANVATLAYADASYVPGVENFAVDTSDGWVSLGVGGSIDVRFPLISQGVEESLYLFIGEVGPQDESPAASVAIELFVGSVTYHVPDLDPNTPVDINPGEQINLDGTPPESPTGPATWEWDLDGDGQFDDATGQTLGLTHDYLTGTLSLPPGVQPVRMRIRAGGGDDTYGFALNVVPEPLTIALLATASVGLLRRRRRIPC